MKRVFNKLTALILSLSVILPTFLLLPSVKAEDEGGDEITVAYNREYEDGWNYDNGFDLSMKCDLDVNLTYVKMSASWYNYYMRLSAGGDRGGYVSIPLGEKAPTEGKIFFEFDLKANEGNNIGGAVMIAGVGDEAILSHVVSMVDGELFLLGESAGTVPTSFESIVFTFDLDYGTDGRGEAGEMLATVTYDGLTFERVYKTRSGVGLSGVYLGAQENLVGYERDGDEYFLDNVRLYFGSEAPCELNKIDYGYAVNITVPRDFPVLGTGSVGGYLSGSPDFEDRLPEGSEGVYVYFNRYFSDGWDYDVGFTNTVNERGNDFEIATDYSAEVGKGDAGYLNYYWQFTQRNIQNGFLTLETSMVAPKNKGKIYVEFDLKACDGATIPGMIAILTPGTPILEFTLMSLDKGNLTVLGETVGRISEEWCHIALEIDLDYGPSIGNDCAIKYTAYVGSEGKKVEVVKYLQNSTSAIRGLRHLRIGRGGTTKFHEGDWYGLDNLQVYSAPYFAELDDSVCGSIINPNTTKDFSVNSDDGAPSVADIADASLTMKVGSNNALLKGEKIKLFEDSDGNAYGGPFKENGKVMVPLEPILNYTSTPVRYNSSKLACDIFIGGEYRSIAVGRDTIMVAGKEYNLAHAPMLKSFGENRIVFICLDDVERIFGGFYVTWDEVGFISIVEKYDDYVNRDSHEEFMLETMKRFIYDEVSEGEIYQMAYEHTNGFDHPYLYTTQERFDELYAVYHSVPGDEIYDEDLFRYIHEAVKYADEYVRKYAKLEENETVYVGLMQGRWQYSSQGIVSKWDTSPSSDNHSIAVQPYPDSNGYDPAGGRLNILSDGETCVSMAAEAVAFAYQVTRDEKYARFTYDLSYALCQWQHWSPGHYLTAGETARNLGIAYDFLYDAWIELGLDPKPIRDGINKHTTYTAWRSLNNLAPEYTDLDGYNGSRWWRHIGNWNPVCASGVLVAAFLSMEDPNYVEDASFVASKTIYYLGQNGFNYYGFDGSYRESAGYWCATIRFSQYCILAVMNTLGTDLGLLDAPGMDITNYFGFQVESSDYVRWNYHDDWLGSQPSWWLYTSAYLFENPDFAALRAHHLKTGKNSYRWDAIWYSKPEGGTSNLPLDYVMESIDASVSRSSWDSGALYAGIMGGVNNVAHGQYDSGNWIYENKGIRWFCDLGADDYNLYGGGLGGGYYKYSAEGNNTLAFASDLDVFPHGMALTKGGEIIYSNINEHGSATVIDQSQIYGASDYVSYARRGMFVTNDRSTVVIQDEVNLTMIQDLYWFAHFDTRDIATYKLSEDAKTCIMKSKPDKSGKTYTLRVSLITANRGLKFEIWDTYKYVLDTPEQGYSYSMNGIAEQKRDQYKKLVIDGSGVLKFEVAVVIELIDEENPVDVGYKLGWEGQKTALRPMLTWVPEADSREHLDPTGPQLTPKPTPSLYSLLSYGDSLADYAMLKDIPSEEREEIFDLLANVEHVLYRFGRDHDNEELDAVIELYDKIKATYDKYFDPISSATDDVYSVVTGLVGVG